jgi:ATP-dependent Clp protease ATP-binding subunit ClpA
VKIDVAGDGLEKKLTFEFLPIDPSKRPKARDSEEDDDTEEEPMPALVDATPKKALPGPRDRKDKPRSSTGTVPSVPRRKDE